MAILYVGFLLVAIAIAWRRRRHPCGRGWRWFAAWASAGALITLSFLAGFSVGLALLPIAGAALFLVATRAPHLFEGLGLISGVGIALLVAGASLRGDYRPCPADGDVSIPAGAPADAAVECGGADPTAWLLGGLVASAAAALSYAWVQHHRTAD